MKIEQGLLDVVREAYKRTFTVQSDYARAQSEYVGMAASLGLISTRVSRGIFSRHWRPTVHGLAFLDTMQMLDDEAAVDNPDGAYYVELNDSTEDR